MSWLPFQPLPQARVGLLSRRPWWEAQWVLESGWLEVKTHTVIGDACRWVFASSERGPNMSWEGSKRLNFSVSQVFAAVSHPLLEGMQIGAATLGNILGLTPEVHQPQTLPVFVPGCILERDSCAWTLGDLYKNVHSISVHNSKAWKQPRCPSLGEWMNTLRHDRTMEYYTAVQTN